MPGMIILYSMFASYQIRQRATSKIGSQPGDCRWSLRSSAGGCVVMHDVNIVN